MNLKKFNESLDRCEALVNYPELKIDHEKLSEENAKLKKKCRELEGLKLDSGKTLAAVSKKIRDKRAEIKRFESQNGSVKALLGLKGSLDEVPPETLLKMLENMAHWLKEKGWTLNKILYTYSPLSEALTSVATRLKEEYKLETYKYKVELQPNWEQFWSTFLKSILGVEENRRRVVFIKPKKHSESKAVKSTLPHFQTLERNNALS